MVDVFCILLLIIDLLSKEWIERRRERYLSSNGKCIYIRYTRNYGVALNFLSNKKKIIYILNTLILLYLIYLGYYLKETPPLIKLILAGGLGNLIDRIYRGYVVDFIAFKWKKLPIFNLADFYVIYGIIGILIVEGV